MEVGTAKVRDSIKAESDLLRAQERHREIDAVRLFTTGIANEDFGAVVSAMGRLQYSAGYFRRIIAAAKTRRTLSAPFRAQMLDYFLHNGDALRSAAANDLILIDFLRAVLPRYSGPAITLFRGESLGNRTHRRYGLSWSASKEIGRDFAQRDHPLLSTGASVLLMTKAPARAVICAPALLNNRYGEEEYIVDRRQLHKVTVLERFCVADRAKLMSPSGTMPF